MVSLPRKAPSPASDLRSIATAGDCVTALRAASNVIVDWLHVEGFPVRSVISETMLVRPADQILLIGVTDITELIWTTPLGPLDSGTG
jgi:hypothetical protein